MDTYTDEHIEYWGDVYQRECVALYGVSFFQFLYNPNAWLAAIYLDQYAPLLPEQVAVRDRLIASETESNVLDAIEELALRNRPGVRVRDGAFIEQLRHSRYETNGVRARIGRVV